MQESKEWRQLNPPAESTFIEFPMAFTGKPPKGSKEATVFTGLLWSNRFLLSVIHTLNKMNGGEPAKITYEYLYTRLGMPPATVRAAIKTLTAKKIIEGAGRSKYKIIVDYYKGNYVNIDDWLFKKEFYEVYGKADGQKTEKVKKLSYSRIFGLFYLKRANENEKTGGEYISSPRRFGKAVNIPTSTAGDTFRELAAADLMRAERLINPPDKRDRGCSRLTVNPEVLTVKHPQRGAQAALDEESKADELHKRFMLDTEYRGLIERIDVAFAATVAEIRRAGPEITPEYEQLEAELAELSGELDRFFAVHNVARNVFPPGFFKCDNITEYEQI